MTIQNFTSSYYFPSSNQPSPYSVHSMYKYFLILLEHIRLAHLLSLQSGLLIINFIDICNIPIDSYLLPISSKPYMQLMTMHFYKFCFATVYKGNIIKNLIMDCQSYTKYRPNETTGGIFVSWRRKEELPTGA